MVQLIYIYWQYYEYEQIHKKNYSDKNGHKFNSAIDIESKNVKLFQLLIFC
jgi:hypothetical protein